MIALIPKLLFVQFTFGIIAAMTLTSSVAGQLFEYKRSPEELRQVIQFCGEDAPILSHFDKDKGKCYEVGTTYPPESLCGRNAIFKTLDRVYGSCQCDSQCTDQVPMAFYRPNKSCHFVYSRGPCDTGFYVQIRDQTGDIFNPDGEALCVRNPCPTNMDSSDKREAEFGVANVVWFNERCVKRGTHQPECTPNEVVDIDGLLKPRCINVSHRLACSSAAGYEDPCPRGMYKPLGGGDCLLRSKYAKK